MDGDAKINFKEFELGLKSSLCAFTGNTAKKRPKSGGVANKLIAAAKK